MPVRNIFQELKEKGIIELEGGGDAKLFLNEKRKVYLGIDPTADSLHVGNLVPIILMKHLALAGHDIYFLIGGGTGMIGDPRESGERSLLEEKVVENNTKFIKKQLTKVLGSNKYKIYNNSKWLLNLKLIDFLRSTAKHFTVNQLVKREMVKRRLDAEDPLSFTEFSYSLLQAYDYFYLFQKEKIDLQIGGTDQWANIISGVDLIRKRSGSDVFALTTPIITEGRTGKKFGKSEGNAIWLDERKTSVFSFYQFWLSQADVDLERYLKIFTFLSKHDIDAILSEHSNAPELRKGQEVLAYQVTSTVHGNRMADSVKIATELLYSCRNDFSKDELSILKNFVPFAAINFYDLENGYSIVDAAILLKLATSKSEVRRIIDGGGAVVNNRKVKSSSYRLTRDDFVSDTIVFSLGKKRSILLLRNVS